METPKEYYYTYYSYEEWGRGYFGSRGCKCLPEEDINYFGSFSDKNFNPTQKIILKDDYATREEAYADEIILHDYYDVANNPHFANKSNLTTTKFCVPIEQAIQHGKKLGEIYGKISGRKTFEEKLGIFSFSPDERKKHSGKGGINCKKNGTGIFSFTPEEMKENSRKGGKIGGKKCYENNTGIFSITPEKKIESIKKGGEKCYENGTGIFSLTPEQKSEAGKKGGKKGAKTTNSQKWMCLETGYISNSGGLSSYQKARGIDTSKTNRRRIS
jgi:general stress protein YciG